MTVFQSGEVVKITLNIKDESGNLTQPDTVDSLVIEAPDKTVIETITSGWSNSDVGVYEYVYQLPEQYSYVIVKWTYTHNNVTDVEKTKIRVKYV